MDRSTIKKIVLLTLAAGAFLLYRYDGLIDEELAFHHRQLNAKQSKRRRRRVARQNIIHDDLPTRVEQDEAVLGTATPTDDRRPTRRLIHVFNTYHDGSSDDGPFSPLGHEQWIALASVRDAREAYRERRALLSGGARDDPAFDSVTIVCAVLEEDAEALADVLRDYCDAVPVLPRSTADAYEGLRSLPFVQDIIDAGVSSSSSGYAPRVVVEGDATDSAGAAGIDDEFYLVYTNSDIAAMKQLYILLERELRMKGLPLAMSVNRMTVVRRHLPTLMDFYAGQPLRKEGTGELDAITAGDRLARSLMNQARRAVLAYKGKTHPGHDCFVFHSSLLRTIDFGDLFIGYPPFAEVVRNVMIRATPDYTMIRSGLESTFHVDDARAWLKNRRTMVSKYNDRYLSEEDLGDLHRCPFKRDLYSNVHGRQLTMNCGKLYRQRDSHGRKFCAFVREGYEQAYMDLRAKR